MIGFILTGHGEFSNGLKSALDMVAGDQPAFSIVPFEGSQAATFGDDLRAAITSMRAECEEGVIVFCDLLGGTPFNQTMMIANDVDKIEIVTGANLPLIIELLFARMGATDAAALAEQAVTVGRDAITHQSLASVMANTADDSEEDGI
ncbi:MAG: PTS fructose transporter subunit IIA [Coriobacteriaceae bacterium]|nr:PTS fructose transporter subunit IIA [Coriobacteriaceae bacterium]